MKKLIKILHLISCLINKKDCDKQTAFRIVTLIGGKLLPEYKFNFPEIEWWNDSDFNAYLRKFDENHGFNSNRRWMLKQLLRLVEHIEGDTAECGAFRGASSYLILQANKRNPSSLKTHHIFDSFEGLSKPDKIDGTHWNSNDLAASTDELIGNLSPFTVEENYKIYKGWIPSRFTQAQDLNFSFVHIDVDLYQPTLDPFHFFYPRLMEGGVLLCDDFGFESCPGARSAADEYFANKNEKMIELPDGGGFLIKGQPVAS